MLSFQTDVSSLEGTPLPMIPRFAEPQALLALTENGQVVFRVQLSQAGEHKAKRGGGLWLTRVGWKIRISGGFPMKIIDPPGN